MKKFKSIQLLPNHKSMADIREALAGSFNGFFSTDDSKISTIIDTLNGVITIYEGNFLDKDKEGNFIATTK